MENIDKSLNFRLVYKISNEYKFYYINLFQYLNNAITPNPNWDLISVDQFYTTTKNGEDLFVNDIIEFEAERYAYYSKSKNDKFVIARGLVVNKDAGGIDIKYRDILYNQKICAKRGRETEERYLSTYYDIHRHEKTKLIGNIYNDEDLLYE